jgi:hypothetical protein
MHSEYPSGRYVQVWCISRPGRLFGDRDQYVRGIEHPATAMDSDAMTPDEEQRALAGVEERVGQRHPDVDRGEITDWVRSRAADFEGSRIRSFVPLLVEGGVLGDLRSGPSRATHNR